MSSTIVLDYSLIHTMSCNLVEPVPCSEHRPVMAAKLFGMLTAYQKGNPQSRLLIAKLNTEVG